jgi:hypothetical protein
MSENIVVLNKENMISAFGITITDDYTVSFKNTNNKKKNTSEFNIESKSKPYLGDLLSINTFEHKGITTSFVQSKVQFTPDGVVTLDFELNHPKIQKIMTTVYHYMKVFMMMTHRDILWDGEQISLVLLTTYKQTDMLSLDTVSIGLLEFVEPVYTVVDDKEVVEHKESDVLVEVDNFLATMNLKKIDEDTDISSFIESIQAVLCKIQ